MIVHSVIFSLNHADGSPEERRFLDDAQRILSAIPGVQNFQRLRQVSRKNDHAFGFSMEFAGQPAYDGYNDHPDHVAFVRPLGAGGDEVPRNRLRALFRVGECNDSIDVGFLRTPQQTLTSSPGLTGGPLSMSTATLLHFAARPAPHHEIEQAEHDPRSRRG